VIDLCLFPERNRQHIVIFLTIFDLFHQPDNFTLDDLARLQWLLGVTKQSTLQSSAAVVPIMKP
jgi:hypothetical protein